MPISITKGINFNSSGSAIINNEIIFNQTSNFNSASNFNQQSNFNNISNFNQQSNFNNISNFNENVVFNKNISTVSGTSSEIFEFQKKLIIPNVSGTENRLIWIT